MNLLLIVVLVILIHSMMTVFTQSVISAQFEDDGGRYSVRQDAPNNLLVLQQDRLHHP
jgi:hypothetical protein